MMNNLLERLQFLNYLTYLSNDEIIAFCIVIALFLLYGLLVYRQNKSKNFRSTYYSLINKYSKNKNRRDYNKNKATAYESKYKEPKLYKNFLEKYKLEESEGAHYNSDKWSTNPKLYNGVELALERKIERDKALPNESYVKKHNLDISKIKIECPICQGIVTKKKNPISKTNVYSCDNVVDCSYSVRDLNKIYPFKVLNMKDFEPDNDEITKCPSCDGYLFRSQCKSTNMPVFTCSNFPDCRYGPIENSILKNNVEF